MSITTADERTPAEALGERLDEPRVAEALGSLLDNAELLALLVSGLDGFIRHGETMLDSALDSLADARKGAEALPGLSGVDGPSLQAAGTAVLGALPSALAALTALLESGALEELRSPEAAGSLALLARGLNRGAADYRTNPVPVSGVRSLARLLRDEDLRRGLSFLTTVGRGLGRVLAEDRPGAVPVRTATDH